MDYETDSLFPRNKTGRDSNIRNMFDKGKVIEVLVMKHKLVCRVQYLDKQGLISKPLPVKQFGSRSTSAFWCPKIGDDVSICRSPNSEGSDDFIDGSFYNTGNPPPITDPDTRHFKFNDGAVIEYTEKAPARSSKRGTAAGGAGRGTLTAKGISTVNLQSSGDTTITCANLIINGNVRITGNVTIIGKLTVDGNMLIILVTCKLVVGIQMP